MKVLVNGGINLSTLDGWWAEAYEPRLGWPLGDGKEHADERAVDAADAQELYRVLEQEVIPAFYARDEHGLPTAWLARMRESMCALSPAFSASRNVMQYCEQHYLPAAAAYRARAADKGASGAQAAQWRRALEQKWSQLRFGQVHVETQGDHHQFTVQLYLGELNPKFVRVELYANPEGGAPFRHEMAQGDPAPGGPGGHLYHASVSAHRPATDYTPRVLGNFPSAAIPLEASQILWQR
jgi:starch phosphorylase